MAVRNKGDGVPVAKEVTALGTVLEGAKNKLFKSGNLLN